MLGLGGSAQLGIGIAVMLEDRFSANARRVATSMRLMKDTNTQMIRTAISEYQSMASRVAMVAGGITFAMGKAIQKGAEFNQIIQKIAVVGEGKLPKGRMGKLAKSLGEEFGMNPTAVGAAIFENTKAGVTTSIDLITKYQIAVATATGEMLEGQDGVAKGLLNIANSMKINYANFGAVANAVTVAANQSMASVESLTETMAYSANDFFQLYGGNTQEQRVNAMAKNLSFGAMLSQMGIEGSSAGTAIANLLRYSTTASGAFSTKRQKGALAMMGLKPADLRTASGNMMDPLDMMDLFASRLKDMPTGDQLDAMFGVLGVRGKKAGINLMGPDGQGVSSRDMYAKIMKGIKQDIAIKQAKEMMDTLQGDLAKAKAKWASFLIDFTNAVEPLLRKAIPAFTKIIGGLSSFVNTGIGGWIARLALVAAPLVAMIFAFRAATLGATLALSSFSQMAGYGTLMRGGLGLAGMNRMASNGLAKNAAGRWYVMAGNPMGVRNAAGGLMRGGQLVGAAALGRLGGGLAGAASAAGGGIMAAIGGPWGLGITLALAFLPQIYDLVKGLFGNSEEDKNIKGYQNKSFDALTPGYDPTRTGILNRLGLSDVANQEINQKIEVFVNGQSQGTKDFNSLVSEQEHIMQQIDVDLGN